MPGIVSEINGVDTVAIHNASEAFLGGSIPPREALPDIQVDEALWTSDPVFGAMVVGAVIVGIICIPRILKLSGNVFGCLLRWKETANLTASVPLSRDRNTLCTASLLPLSLISARYRLFELDLMDGKAPWVVALISLGLLFLLFLFRNILVYNFGPRRLADLWKISRTNFYNGIIVVTIIGLLVSGIGAITDMPDITVKKILLHVFGGIFFIFFYRNLEILSWKGQRFKAFLYLCALELTPIALLVVSTIIF